MDNLEFVTKAHKNKILVEFLAPKRVAKAANNNLGTILADVIIPGKGKLKMVFEGEDGKSKSWDIKDPTGSNDYFYG